MSVETLSDYTAVGKYARYVQEKQRRETWSEAVDRCEKMMVGRFEHLREIIHQSYDYVRRKKVLGSMRTMQFGGPPMLKHHARGYNCTSSYCDRLRFFQEFFYLLLCGCGTGFSVQDQHVASLPRFSARRRAGAVLPRKVFAIPDCIEGWADAVGVLLSSYHEEPVLGLEEYHDCEVEFDPSPIRRRGAPLSCGIGRAPGPDPLMYALTQARSLLDRALQMGLSKLSPLLAYDLAMYFADASVAGGVRRSATIAIFSPWDIEMATCKTGAWRDANPQRGRSNNSAALLRNSTTWEEFYQFFEYTRQWGEPGFYWTDDYDIIPNPCVEVSFLPRLKVSRHDPIIRGYQGPILHCGHDQVMLSGWQMCNLTTINGKTANNREEFFRRCEAASVLGTLQASFTDFPYLGRVSEEIVRKEALLGVSICGMMHHPEILLDPEVQREGAGIVLKTNERIAQQIGINPCARGTCIKPDGKSSAVLGSEPGIIPAHSMRHFRIVQANHNEAIYQYYKAHNPHSCEPSVWSTLRTDDCVRFCIEQPEGTVCKADVTAVEMLKNIRLTYENWVKAGRRAERCTHEALQNNVSNTVHVRPDEWLHAAGEIYQFRRCYAGVSLVADSCDRDYPQAPYTAVYTPQEQEEMYGPRAVELAPYLVAAAGDFTNLWDACDCVLGLWDPNVRQPNDKQKVWTGMIGLFAQDIFGGDLRKATYALKDAYNWELWCRIKEYEVPVDYSQLVEYEDGTTLQQEVACAGGACLVEL